MANGFSCCYRCADRALGCHGICKDYIEEVQKNNELKDRLRKESDVLSDVYAVKRYHKTKRTRSNKKKTMHLK